MNEWIFRTTTENFDAALKQVFTHPRCQVSSVMNFCTATP